jgi:molybdopterin/thiamine biosynthesis adenylyltransferase
MTRYARQTILPEVGEAGQARLAAAHVLVVGAGGLGAAALPGLAGAGVGRITVVDGDRVEVGNLHRQTLYRMTDLGRPKAQAAAYAMAALNPEVAARPVVGWLDPATAPDLLAGVDAALDCADSFAASYALSDACHARGVPMISASALGRAGYAGGFCGGAPSLRAVFPDLPARAATCATAGVMGPVVAALGALQAQMALSALLGHAPGPLGRMITLDAAAWRMGGFSFAGAPEPADGPALIAPSQIGPDDLAVELRSAAEAPRPAAPHALRVAPGDVGGLRVEPGRRVVFCCRTGLRAWAAAATFNAIRPGPVAVAAANPDPDPETETER